VNLITGHVMFICSYIACWFAIEYNFSNAFCSSSFEQFFPNISRVLIFHKLGTRMVALSS